ncbi:hypothetical protein CC1G_12649 [Coprinopsis cinerea okayama7|uniref:Uncharacterized protein n=1 Tax=Coprinopsis cinerea (strain Okayama-7 / 130 / ATCC MYA-4618 / FGSC 9003) TaxID=240176 RepID=A8NE33_COPC7|nr:hypothetical protein CC1G_12649 [Coprinopsis cinerea okayama7\|eukprot:XP_001832935.1 hypothetical protein CC1G_12649 [Coprinopsis cinerea okayama7\
MAGKPLPVVAAGFAGVNAGMTAATFFGLREFIVSPLLVHNAPWRQYAVRRKERGIPKPGDSVTLEESSVADIRSNKLLDTGISGAVTGGLMRGWKSGRKAIIPGALLASTIALGIQYGFNYAAASRIKNLAEERTAPPPAPPTPEQLAEEKLSWHVRLGNRIVRAFGVEPISDEEFLRRLRTARNKYELRIKELEKEIAEEEATKSVESHSS